MSGSHIKSQGIRNTCICLNSDSLSHRSFSSIHSCKINRNKSLDLQYIMLKTLLFWFLLSKHTELRIMSTQMFTSVVLFVCLCFVCVALLRFLFVIVIFCHTHGVHIPTLECQHSFYADSLDHTVYVSAVVEYLPQQCLLWECFILHLHKINHIILFFSRNWDARMATLFNVSCSEDENEVHRSEFKLSYL